MPVITDEHSITITLSKDGIVQEDYKQGDIITEVGNYELIVKDAATNTTIITFSIEEPKAQIEITSEKYEIDDKYITKIQPKTTVMEFKIAIETNATTLDILSINKYRLNKKNLDEVYLKAADVTEDGKVDFKDIVKINKFRLHKIGEI